MIGDLCLLKQLFHLSAGSFKGVVVGQQEHTAGAQLTQDVRQLLEAAAAHPDGLNVHLVGPAAGAWVSKPCQVLDGALINFGHR